MLGENKYQLCRLHTAFNTQGTSLAGSLADATKSHKHRSPRQRLRTRWRLRGGVIEVRAGNGTGNEISKSELVPSISTEAKKVKERISVAFSLFVPSEPGYQQ